jgi:pyruvate kinase
MTIRRTRIVATLGPATDPPEVLRAILEAGVDVARINFSHGSAGDHLARIACLREAAKNLSRPVAVLADLPGPKLRVNQLRKRELQAGKEVRFSLRAEAVQVDDLTITEPEMLAEIRPGQRILLDDGRLQLEAMRTESDQLVALVVVGGALMPNKGVNLPDTPLTIPPLTDRDREALAVAARAGVDWLALSFVRQASAADELRKEAEKHGLRVPVLAKMERPEAVANAESIVAAFDGIMVARGDLGVEIPLEKVPPAQKHLINLARSAGKPVITATDMLDSMRQNPRPTRAEASDVANAIFDGTDAVMLSGETAVGSYPVEAVQCMHRIALEAESHLRESDTPFHLTYIGSDRSLDDHITHTVVDLALKVNADAIITPTISARTARLVARHRPATLVVAPTRNPEVLRQMAIIWGVVPVLMATGQHAGEDRMKAALKAAFNARSVQKGQLAIILAGHPEEGGPHLPTIRFVRVGEEGAPVEP